MFEMKKLDFEFSDLEPYISAKTMDFHYNKHYKGYVDKLNELIAGTPYEKMSLERIIKESNESDEGKTVRGMKVLSENSMPIKKLSNEESEKTSSKKELSESQKADIEARKNARVAAANAAIKANETKAKKPMSDAQKAALAKARAKAQEKREAQAKENNSNKGE